MPYVLVENGGFALVTTSMIFLPLASRLSIVSPLRRDMRYPQVHKHEIKVGQTSAADIFLWQSKQKA